MRVFLLRILVASQWGASLALASGCSTQIDSGTSTNSSGGQTGGGADPGTTSSGGQTGGGTGATSPDASAPLPPYPEPTCNGPEHDGGYYGRCCEEVHCAAPSDGACPSDADQDALSSWLSGRVDLPPGSGTCVCGDIRGPYASRTPGDPKSCCYLVGSISCEGRPLVIHGAPRLAALTRGPSAWSRTAWRRFERASRRPSSARSRGVLGRGERPRGERPWRRAPLFGARIPVLRRAAPAEAPGHRRGHPPGRGDAGRTAVSIHRAGGGPPDRGGFIDVVIEP